MFTYLRNRGLRIPAPSLFWVIFAVAALGCGDSSPTDAGPDGPDPTDPGPIDPNPSSWSGPAPVGEVMYAVDLANNFLVFGSESGDVLTAKMKITGVPILKRIIGLALRPSNGTLYGIGNDSRVYIIDPLAAKAMPVNEEPFTPKIAGVFDIHFAMDLEPNGNRVRLIAAESGGNWSISLDDGTAVLDPNAKYADGTPLEGRTPALLGMVYPSLPDSAKQEGWCANLAYAMDADEAIMLASCDPATGKWWPTGAPADDTSIRQLTASFSLAGGAAPKAFEDLKDQLLRCGEFMPSVEGSESDGERVPKDDRLFGPRTPDTPFWVFLSQVGQASNRVGVVKPFDTDPWLPGVTFHWEIPSPEPIQSVEWVPSKYVPPTSNLVWSRTPKSFAAVGDGGDDGYVGVPGAGRAAPADSGVRCGE